MWKNLFMLNFHNNLPTLLLLLACRTDKETPLLPETQLGAYTPIIRHFRYNKLQAWIVKPPDTQQNKLYLAAQIQEKELKCFEDHAEQEPTTLFLLATPKQQELAIQYVSGINSFSIETQELPCP